MTEKEIFELNLFVQKRQKQRRTPEIIIGMYKIWCPTEWFNKNGTMKRTIIRKFEKLNKRYT